MVNENGLKQKAQSATRQTSGNTSLLRSPNKVKDFVKANMDLSPVESDESPDSKRKSSRKRTDTEDRKRQIKTEGGKRNNIRGASEPAKSAAVKEKKKLKPKDEKEGKSSGLDD
jgi:hypothetical protein